MTLPTSIPTANNPITGGDGGDAQGGQSFGGTMGDTILNLNSGTKLNQNLVVVGAVALVGLYLWKMTKK